MSFCEIQVDSSRDVNAEDGGSVVLIVKNEYLLWIIDTLKNGCDVALTRCGYVH